MTSKTFTGVEQGEQKYSRSELVFAALAHVQNRYQLCQLTAKGARKLHKPNERMQDTVNHLLMILDKSGAGGSAPIACRRISESTLHSLVEASHVPDATHIDTSHAVFIPEERNFSHV